MDTEMQLILAFEAICQYRYISQEVLAERMGKKREAITRLHSSDDANPTLKMMIELLSVLNITADITLREAKEGESPIHVVTELSSSLGRSTRGAMRFGIAPLVLLHYSMLE
ncbi:MAG: hypothetical protein NVS9B9_00610 [Ktedonobacteraceae bacterium]